MGKKIKLKYRLVRDMQFNDSSKPDGELFTIPKGSIFFRLYYNEFDRFSKEMYNNHRKKHGKKFIILDALGVQRGFLIGKDVEQID